MSTMAELTTFANDAPVDEILEAFRRDGACIIADAMPKQLLERVNGETAAWIERTPMGRDAFTGFNTSRTGALVARSPACREVVMHQRVLELANSFLLPFAERIQLHLTQIIRIMPEQGAQPLHRDRLAWGGYIPTEIEPQFNTIWALTDFSAENGATRVVPGSPHWQDGRSPEPDEIGQAVMSAGSVLLYSGSVIHGGGENRSGAPRVGMNITYCLGWLRTEENQYLSCPPQIARTLDPGLQELMGYTMGSYALGYYSPPDGDVSMSDIRPPEFALGRKPRSSHALQHLG